MKLLLDTHVFLWLMTDPARLSTTAADACNDDENLLYLSVASFWEIQFKSQRGKLELDLPLEQIVREQTADDTFRLLPVEIHHVLALDRLAVHHNDPFDRILICQAQTETMALVTADAHIHAYVPDVKVVW